MHRRSAFALSILAIFCFACSDPAQPEVEASSGDESAAAPSEGADASNEDTTGALVGVYGVAEPGTAVAMPSEAEIEAARAQREAEQRARAEQCRGITVPTGQRPPMPSLTPAASLAEHERVYRDSQAVTPPTPTDPSMPAYQAWGEAMVDWLRIRTTAIGSLQGGVGDLAPPERAIAAAWVAHSYLDIAEAFTAPDAPENVAADPELRSVYREAILEQTRPLVEQAGQAFAFCSDYAMAPLTAHCAEMQTFAAGLACATE